MVSLLGIPTTLCWGSLFIPWVNRFLPRIGAGAAVNSPPGQELISRIAPGAVRYFTEALKEGESEWYELGLTFTMLTAITVYTWLV